MEWRELAVLLGADDPARLGALAGAAFLGGLVRGFTGFGFAMVFIPIASLVVTPMAAVGLVWVMDAPFAAPLAAGSVARAQWREVLPLLAGATLLLPAGVWLLTHLDPLVTRWIVAGLILCAVAALACGWRYAGRPSLRLSAAVGGLSGLTNGLAGLGGMPLAIFWLGSQRNDAAQTRHNLLSYFALNTVVSGVVLAFAGVVTVEIAWRAALLLAPYGLGVALGMRGFRLASETIFRRIAYALIAAAAILALPALDPWLR